MKNKLFIISGPSGVGEDSVIEGLRDHLDIERVITTTTRKMRPGETDGNPYYFISEEKFKENIQEGKMTEWAQEYNDQYYGVTNEEIERVKNCGKIGIWKIEYKGVINMKKVMPTIKSIFINAPLEILEKRIRSRSDVTEEFVKERLDYTKKWLKYSNIYDYEVINEEGKLNETIEKVAKIIKNES